MNKLHYLTASTAIVLMANTAVPTLAHAEEVTVPATGEAVNTSGAPYTLTLDPQVTVDGTSVEVRDGAYTFTQTAETGTDGQSTPTPDAIGVKMNVTGVNTATLEEDGIYEVKQTERSPGFLLDTKTYSYTFPVMTDGTRDPNQTITMSPKLTPVSAPIDFVKAGTDGQPLAGTTFEVYQLTDAMTGNTYQEGEKLVATVTTGTDGSVKTDSLPEGKYYLVETAAADGYAINTSKIFYEVTATEDGLDSIAREVDGDLVNNDTNTFTNYQLPDINKLIQTDMTPDPADEVQDAPASLAGSITYPVSVTVPSDIENYKSFRIVDTLPEYLVMTNASDSLVTSLNGLGLIQDTDYTLEIAGQTFTIDFTEAGMDKLDQMAGSTGEPLRFSYAASLDITKDVPLETSLVNDIHLIYDNNVGATGDIQDDVGFIVKAGAIEIDKLDGTTNDLLSGAEFAIYQRSTRQLNIREFSGPETYSYNGLNWTLALDPKTGEPLTGLTADGVLQFQNLAFGDYILVETKAPTGYNLNNNPVEFTISDTDTQAIEGVEDSIRIDVKNYKTADALPMTGTAGTLIGTSAIAGLLALIGALQYFKRRRTDEAR